MEDILVNAPLTAEEVRTKLEEMGAKKVKVIREAGIPLPGKPPLISIEYWTNIVDGVEMVCILEVIGKKWRLFTYDEDITFE